MQWSSLVSSRDISWRLIVILHSVQPPAPPLAQINRDLQLVFFSWWMTVLTHAKHCLGLLCCWAELGVCQSKFKIKNVMLEWQIFSKYLTVYKYPGWYVYQNDLSPIRRCAVSNRNSAIHTLLQTPFLKEKNYVFSGCTHFGFVLCSMPKINFLVCGSYFTCSLFAFFVWSCIFKISIHLLYCFQSKPINGA